LRIWVEKNLTSKEREGEGEGEVRMKAATSQVVLVCWNCNGIDNGKR